MSVWDVDLGAGRVVAVEAETVRVRPSGALLFLDESGRVVSLWAGGVWKYVVPRKE